MKNVSDSAQMPFWEKLKNSEKTGENIHIILITNICYALLGFLFANASIFTSSAPFGAAFFAASPKKYEISSATGVILGSVLFADSDFGMKYIVAVLIIAGIKTVLRSSKLAYSDFVYPVMTFAAVFSMSIALTVIKGASIYDIIMSAGESIMAAGSTYFFLKSRYAAESYFSDGFVLSENIPCIAASAAIALLSLIKIEIATISVGRTLCCIFILIFANSGFLKTPRESAGAVCGITAGSLMAVANTKYAFLTGAYGFGGLIAGVFAVFGRFVSAMAFLAVNAAVALIFSRDISVLTPIAESFFAAVIFLFIPSDILDGVFVSDKKAQAQNSSGAKSLLLSRLEAASNAFKDIASTTQKVSQKLGVIEGESIESVYENTAVLVCSRCGSNIHCWQKKYTDTMNAFNDMTSVIRREGKLTEQDIPEYLAQRCSKTDKLAEEFCKNYLEYSGKVSAQHRLNNIREIVTDQFDGLASALEGLYSEIGQIHYSNSNMRSDIIRLIEKFGIETESVTCFDDEYGRMTIEITLESQKASQISLKLCRKISEICEREFEEPQSVVHGNTARVILREKAIYSAVCSAAQLCRNSERLCGDSFESFNDLQGNFHVILSDGMGSGGRAAVDSSMASNLLKRLIQAGIDYTAALKLVNSALLVKSEDESLATIDALKIDMYTGAAEILKAGAAPTFIRRSGKCMRIDSASMPAGILRSVEFEKSSVKLSEDDMVVMVSDGAVASSDEWILSEMELYGDMSAQEIAEKIAKTAKIRADKREDDDITVIAVKIEKVDI